ncbi:VOC family protein [Catenulispora subtropica]|uniref:VOC family protein n=1 Tax=Catenulispora subtropica TaxID=450798 RepID=A0ABP5DAB0_9ACTN
MKPTEATIGTPCWAELGTGDVPGSGAFYAGLFGWTVETDPREEAGGYTMCSVDGAPVAAMSPLYAPGQPVAWTVSFAVSDADSTAVRTADQGGTVILAPMDVFDIGRFSVLQDPAGAVFCVWQPQTFQGFGLWDEPGAVCWVELATRDVPSANAFYQTVFGWSISDDEYPHLSVDDRQFGGVQDLDKNRMPADVPPHWLLYFKTEDAAASAAKATELGAEVLKGPFELPGTGHFVVVRDPQGAVFALYQAEAKD